MSQLYAKGFLFTTTLLLGLITQPSANAAITYTLYLDGVDAQIRTQITESMKEAVDIYNTYGTFDKELSVVYDPGTPTANANFNGSIVFGGTRNTRTAMHEILHTLGVGTTWQYRQLMVNGEWQGALTNAMIAEFDGPGKVLRGDAIHIWPYGLNYDTEDGPLNRIRSVQVMQAMRCDMGLDVCSGNVPVRSALNIQIDVDSGRNQTQVGFSSLAAEPNSTVNVEGVTFTLFGFETGNSNDLGSDSNLLTDYAASNGEAAFVGVRMENLPTGPYSVRSFHNDSDAAGSINVAFRKQGESGEIVASNHAINRSDPARFIIESDGTSTYELVFQEADSFNRARLNGLTLKPLSSLVRPGILSQWWLGVPGNNVSDLVSLQAYPDRPSGSRGSALFEGPVNFDENYGSRVSGILYAPATGDYTFWIAADNRGELWLSDDGTEASRRLIATAPAWTGRRQWNKYPEQQSETIYLQRGQPYFIEALHKENRGGDHLAVAWQRPGSSEIELLENSYFTVPVNVVNASEGTIVSGIPANTVECAGEDQICMLPAGTTATVWYGARGSWTIRSQVTGSIDCSNQVFGDPFETVRKSCRYSFNENDNASEINNVPPEVELNPALPPGNDNTIAFVESCDVTDVALQRTVKSGVWNLLSLPCKPPPGMGVGELFGDDIPGMLGRDWTVQIFNPATNSYTIATVETELSKGEGFWLIQRTGEDRVLDLPAGSTRWAPSTDASTCPAVTGCVSIALDGSLSPSRWQSIGSPLTTSISVDTLRIRARSGPCSLNSGCSFLEASDTRNAGLVFSPLWRLDTSVSPSVYQAVGSGDVIAPWDGLWIAQAANAQDNEPELYFPIEE